MSVFFKYQCVVIGFVVVVVGLAGCELFDRAQPTEVAAPWSASELAGFIMGDPESTEWGVQYEEGNSYTIVNIPIAGALQVEYGIVDGGTFNIFLETTLPVKLEIGLATREDNVTAESLVNALEWVCVTSQEDETFASVPENVVLNTTHDGAWVQYQRSVAENEVSEWWSPGAEFVFGGATERVCVIENRTMVVAEVSGPFPKPHPTSPPLVSTNAAPVVAGVSISGTLEVGHPLTGNYTYSDADGDPESASVYQWYRADDANGANKAAIDGATAIDYTLEALDTGKYIQFEVIPAAGSGATPGSTAASEWTEVQGCTQAQMNAFCTATFPLGGSKIALVWAQGDGDWAGQNWDGTSYSNYSGTLGGTAGKTSIHVNNLSGSLKYSIIASTETGGCGATDGEPVYMGTAANDEGSLETTSQGDGTVQALCVNAP